MKQVHETDPITTVSEIADDAIEIAGYQAVIVDVLSDAGLEGTLVYFPGVTSSMLAEGVLHDE